MILPPALERLIEELSKMPGVGKKSAKRMAFALLAKSKPEQLALAQSIEHAAGAIGPCEKCHSFTDQQPCPLCADLSRDQRLLCVVEEPKNIYSVEQSGIFRGQYHVLGGAISPLKGIGPEMLNISHLIQRLEEEPIEEIILATNPTLEGEATAHYLMAELEGKVSKITRIARGMPSGGDLEYADANTLARAFEDRLSYSR